MPSTITYHHLEVASWHDFGNSNFRLSGWCHAPNTQLHTIVATTKDRLLASEPLYPRPDVNQHFGNVESALLTGFDIKLQLFSPDEELALSVIDCNGTRIPLATIDPSSRPGRGPLLGDYAMWAALHDPTPPPGDECEPKGPLFSVIVPVHNTPEPFLQACIESVRAQHYQHWEVCIVDDASTGTVVHKILEALTGDHRFSIQRRVTNGGIARASNEALAIAKGKYSVFLDHDDVLRPHALVRFAQILEKQPDLDVIYSDEDKLTSTGKRILPFFKPDFSPEFLRGVMYFGHALCVRTELAKAVGGFDSCYDGVQDYEFALRLTENTQRIGHIPQILYHWRQVPGSSALEGNAKGDMDRLQVAAVQAHLDRMGDPRRARALGGHRVRLNAGEPPSIHIIEFACDKAPVAQLLAAANTCRTAIIVGYLPDIERPTPECGRLCDLASLANCTDSGLVAPVLVEPDGRIFASGWIENPRGPVPCMQGFDPDGDGFNGSLMCNREVSVVAPLCVAVRRDILFELSMAKVGEWSDFCRAIRKLGLFNRICATARVRLLAPWHGFTGERDSASGADPYFNPNFDCSTADYRLSQIAVSSSYDLRRSPSR